MLEALSWHVWCSGDLGDGWAEAMLSKRFQISESLVEECEAVGEARPPRRVAEISDFQWCRDGNLCWRNARAGGSTIVGVRLEGDSPVVEESW